MRAQVQKWGNSLALRIPRSFAVESAIKQGTEVDLSLEEGRLVITPIEGPTYSLDALMAGVTPDNLHDEVDTGPPAGKEAW